MAHLMSSTSSDPQVLVIDDETGSRESMALAIQRAGFVVRTFDDARKALELLDETDTPQLAICDLRMPGLDGLGFLAEVRKRNIELSVILVTGFGSIESAVEAMQRHLTRIGLYSDKVDGKAGMKTRAALGAYQKSAGLKVDCWPSETVLRSIGAAR